MKDSLLLLLGFYALQCAGQDAFDTRPVNAQGTIGQNVTLNCELSDPNYSLFWGNPAGVNVYQKGFGILPGFEGQYYVEQSGNSYNLIVINVDENDAGRYKCECSTLASSAFAEIILLSSSPGLDCTETTSNADNDFGNLVEGDQITLTCQTTFYGLWGPTQIWTDSDGQILTPSVESAEDLIEYTNTKTVTYFDDGIFWIVDSYFPEPPNGTIPDDVTTPPSQYYSRTVPVPTWNEDYQSSQIVVYILASGEPTTESPQEDPVRNINLGNVKDEYNPGDVITCTAEGNPDPSIRWVDESGTVSNSGILVIESSMQGNQTWSCIATNIVDTVTYSHIATISFTVSDPVRNINLDNVKDEYNPGEAITCTAEGNPEPTIRWVDEYGTVSDSGVLEIASSMAGDQTYSCVATNAVGEVKYSHTATITFTVTVDGRHVTKNSEEDENKERKRKEGRKIASHISRP